MVEIFAIYLFCKKIGKAARAQGRLAMPFQILLIVLWFAGEIIGAILGAILAAIIDGPTDGIDPLAYIFALIGAIAGASIPFIILKSTRPPTPFTHAFPVEPPPPFETPPAPPQAAVRTPTNPPTPPP